MSLDINPQPTIHHYNGKEIVIIGGGIVGGIEAYYAYRDAITHNASLKITVYEKNHSIADTTVSNLVPSLSNNEILSTIPRGQELMRNLELSFTIQGGLHIDDVPGINDSAVTQEFKQQAYLYNLDEAGYTKRLEALVSFGNLSMELWQKMYNDADQELRQIFEDAHFSSYPKPSSERKRPYNGYRIVLIYNVTHANDRAERIKNHYVTLGYEQCSLLSPEDVTRIDPFLADFCKAHSVNNIWNHTTAALWQPGGCIDTSVFLPKLYEYLKNKMGDDFQIHYRKKVTAIKYAQDTEKKLIAGLQFGSGETVMRNSARTHYVFCPGEAVGTLRKLDFSEPAYAGIAGTSLLLTIDMPQDKIKDCATFGHHLEVHLEGIGFAWQARLKNTKMFIGIAGAKAFYSDQQPTKYQEFARNRNVLQLNIINGILPEYISLALHYNTKGKQLTASDLDYLESRGIAQRWVGVRAVAYDGFPTLGYLYNNGIIVENARCTTHLGSGGVSCAPAATVISRLAMAHQIDEFSQSILEFGSSMRTAAST